MRRNPPCLILPTDDAPRESGDPPGGEGPKRGRSAGGPRARRREAPNGVRAAAETADENPRGNAGMPTVLITGANRGLGLEFARQYATADWRVIATSRAPDKADALHALGQRVGVHRLDVADLAAVAARGGALAAETIDVLIANAGIFGAREMTAATVPAGAQDWERALRVDVIGPPALAGAFPAPVAPSEQRKMVALTSPPGSMGANNDGGLYAFPSSRAAP